MITSLWKLSHLLSGILAVLCANQFGYPTIDVFSLCSQLKTDVYIYILLSLYDVEDEYPYKMLLIQIGMKIPVVDFTKNSKI